MEAEALVRLGKHKATKGCLYVKRLADIDLKVRKLLIRRSIAVTPRAYPGGMWEEVSEFPAWDVDQNASK
ncbi:MAG: hypothetical protein IT228_07990 [Flavobacteriales bacterium]|nr:hypothetical protein [Flavobacteriales bacterium]